MSLLNTPPVFAIYMVKLFFERMIEVPDRVYGPSIGSSYQFQGVTLSKQFKGR